MDTIALLRAAFFAARHIRISQKKAARSAAWCPYDCD